MSTTDQNPPLDQHIGYVKDPFGLDWTAEYIAGMPTLASEAPWPYETVATWWLLKCAMSFQEIFGIYPNTLVYVPDYNLQTHQALLRVAAEIGGLEVIAEPLHPEGWPQLCLVYFPDPRGGDWDDGSELAGTSLAA